MAGILLGLPWVDLIAALLRLSRKIFRGLADEGVYEVLEHHAALELIDKRGKHAKVQKHQKVRYLQNNIIAYQDQAWGDGDILLNYRCSPGKVVDRYRPGSKILILISLRATRNRGDLDNFNIQWGIKNGFLRESELWESEINHRTKKLKIQVTFPKSRPPQRTQLLERLHQRTRKLNSDATTQLPDGRWLVSWETNRPRLNERYQLQWDW